MFFVGGRQGRQKVAERDVDPRNSERWSSGQDAELMFPGSTVESKREGLKGTFLGRYSGTKTFLRSSFLKFLEVSLKYHCFDF